MTKKELRTIYLAINNAQYAIENLACENYPYTEFYDQDLSDMFYSLNSMCIKITKKIEAIEALEEKTA